MKPGVFETDFNKSMDIKEIFGGNSGIQFYEKQKSISETISSHCEAAARL